MGSLHNNQFFVLLLLIYLFYDEKNKKNYLLKGFELLEKREREREREREERQISYQNLGRKTRRRRTL